MSFDQIWSVCVVEGSYVGVVVGRESGQVEKFRIADLKGKATVALVPHSGCVTGIVNVPGSEEVYTLSADGTVKLLNLTDDVSQLEEGRRQTKSTDCGGPLRCGALSGDVFCGGMSSGLLCIFREEGVDKLEGHRDAISCIHTINESTVATGSYDNQIRIWDVARGASLFVLLGHSSQVKTVHLIGGGAGVVSTARDGTLRVWVLPEAEEHEEDPEGDSASAAVTRVLECASILNLPATPMCGVMPEEADNKLFIGLSGGSSLVVAGSKLFNEVTSFTKRNTLEVKIETRRLLSLQKSKVAVAKRQFKKDVKAFKSSLLEMQEAEKRDVAAAQRSEANQQSPKSQDEEDEEGEEEPPAEEEEEEVEEGDVPDLTEERMQELSEFKEKKRAEMAEQIAAFSKKISDRIVAIAPLAKTKFERSSSEIQRLSTVRYFPTSAADTITCASYTPSGKLVAGVGASVTLLDCKPGLLSL